MRANEPDVVASKRSLIAIVGPTAAGKTRLAVQLARQFNAEIVNADSRQVYRHMDIGTAKPTPEELSLIPHHLIDIINPDDDFSLAQYQRLAYAAIADIQHRGRLPLLVGGTGQYVWATLEGWLIPSVAPDLEFRRQLAERVAGGEAAALYEELKRLDPEAAWRIDQRNVRRVIRALEVTHKAGAPFSQLKKKQAPPLDALTIGLTMERSELHRRTDLRVDRMIEQGLIEEVNNLVKMGYGFGLPAMSSIGYHQIGEYLEGKMTLEYAVQRIKNETHRFIRRQYNWFRLQDERIRWFDIQDNGAEDKIMAAVETLIGRA